MVRRVEGGRCGATDVREAWACRREAWACRACAGIRGPRVREGSWFKDGGSRMGVQEWGSAPRDKQVAGRVGWRVHRRRNREMG